MEEERLRVEMLLDAANLESLEYQLLALSVPERGGEGRETGDLRIKEESDEEEEKREESVGDGCSMTAGTRFNTPLWLAVGLSALRFVRVQLPKWYGADFINLALADPETANLHTKNAYFFEIGAVLAKKLENSRVADFVCEMFLSRVKQIIILILHSSMQDNQSAFVHKLTSVEQKFYDRGVQALADYKIWRGGMSAQVNHARVMGSRKKVKLS